MVAKESSLGARAGAEDEDELDPVPSNELIDEVVSQLNGICRTSSLEFALRVGAVIIHHFYKGDTNAWRDRGPKLNSFRRLSEHPDLPMSAGALYRCVAVFELCERLNAPSRWRRLGASHLRVVLGLPVQSQEELLAAANREHWSVQALELKAREYKDQRPPHGGRRPQSPLVKNLKTLDHCLTECKTFVTDLGSCGAEELDRGLQLLGRLQIVAQELTRAIETRRHVAPARESSPTQWISDPSARELGPPSR